MKMANLKKSYKDNQLAKPDYIARMHNYHKVFFEYAEFIRDTDIKQIEITDEYVVMTSRELGLRMVCDPNDRRIAPIEILNFDLYEKEEGDMILRLVDDGQTVFDIGGNFGWYSMKIAKLKKVKIYTFEPIPKTFNYLKQNVALNGLANIELFNFGFSDCEQDLTFYYYPEGSVNASLANLSESTETEKITCHVTKLDKFIRERNSAIDFIKCDVEGAELLVFKGGIEAIQKNKPIIFTELLRKWSAKFDYHPNEVINLLCNLGYRCFTVNDGKLKEFGHMDDQTMETNFFFLHTEKHNRQLHEFNKPDIITLSTD